jgi:hypothetical protein
MRRVNIPMDTTNAQIQYLALRNRLTSTGSLGSINSTLETATGVWISPVIVGCKRV